MSISPTNLFALSTIALIYIGMMCLNLAMDKHFKQVFARSISQSQALSLKLLGWVIVALSVYCSTLAWTLSIGLAVWFGIATFMVGLMIYIQAYQAKWAYYIALNLLLFLLLLYILNWVL